ncbi:MULTISPECIES: cobyrinate a,c-diamide synthase [unclassified Granulicatella]|uniref:cobyrinate a,c-diamide synthase n=1 Tax=unclassified Granulicatella TaxID=2630493 RepID=UPI001073A315|nr:MULTISPECIES: cobyrinate a,c-diamide synthase [unclassified Granulicatella]MBF0779509.1 cobyrinate a,c-diamide synthase [Granulicatella sp. 19428wC4_WM01]TFU96475.1 cobyrinate a,c-diamide synthase [Granulicatella sp. WM01]
MKRFMLAGVSSGVGKTTLTLGVLKALVKRGLSVQAYKVGPDYIDTAYHTRVVGRASRNIDTFMIPDDKHLRWSFEQAVQGVDVAVVEGVMGLYDGLGTDKDCASSSSVAKKLNIPVVLIVDGKATSTSAAAIVKGFVEFDNEVEFAGVIINRVASKNHYELIKGAIERYTDVPVLGYLPKNISVEMPSRHLGLVPDVEMDGLAEKFDTLGELAEQYIDLDKLLSLCEATENLIESPLIVKDYSDLTIAYALDDAFHFYYKDNLDYLEQLGVTLVPFSPLKDASLPKADGYYIGGGFPEIYAKELEENVCMRQAIKNAHDINKPIYAECGGLMYLGDTLEVSDNVYHMTGVLSGKSVMTERLKNFGYCYATSVDHTLFGVPGTVIRGHEFHHSVFDTELPTTFQLEKKRDNQVVSTWTGGYQVGNTLASYLHIHFYQNEELVFAWLNRLREAKQS